MELLGDNLACKIGLRRLEQLARQQFINACLGSPIAPGYPSFIVFRYSLSQGFDFLLFVHASASHVRVAISSNDHT